MPKLNIPNQPNQFGQKKEGISPSPSKQNQTPKLNNPPIQPNPLPVQKMEDFSNFFGTKPEQRPIAVQPLVSVPTKPPTIPNQPNNGPQKNLDFNNFFNANSGTNPKPVE